MAGLFISFEGGEGCGKSTQARLLAQWLEEQGIPVMLTREPGGTPLAERIRPLLVETAGEEWHPLAETLLFLAARVQHVERAILPALAAGKLVICDRFIDSTLVYQGEGRQVGAGYLQQLHRLTLGSRQPDLTFLLDLPAEQGLARALARKDGEARFEQMDVAFHHRVREGFLALAQSSPGRIQRVDADRAVEPIAKDIQQRVASQLGR